MGAGGQLRIALVGDYPADRRLGSPKVLYELADQFSRQGHDVELLLTPQLGRWPRQRHARDAVSPWLSSRAVKRATAGRGTFDVIDASSAEGFALARNRGARPVLIARSHGLEHLNYRRMLDDVEAGLGTRGWHRRLWYPAVRMRLVAGAARRAHRMIVLNEVDRAYVIAHGWKHPDQLDIVQHGLSARFLLPYRASPRPPHLLFCGSWDRIKGIDFLAPAFSEVARLRPEATLTVLGAGVPPSVVAGAFDEAARARVRVVDRADEQKVASEYLAHRALVMCSTYEGFGLVVPEAMSQGTPVITTPVGAAASLVEDGRTGLLVPPRDARALAAAMLRLLDDDRLAERLGAQAAARVSGMSWGATAERTIEIYRRALRETVGRETPAA